MLALVYDVHANRAALEAVIADARAQGADHWVLGGDYTLFGPEPEATLERLRGLAPAMWIRGNGERWTAQPGSAPENAVVPPAIAACREALGEAAVAELGELPEQGVHEQTRYVHASPISDVRSFFPRPADDEPELLDDAVGADHRVGRARVAVERHPHGAGVHELDPARGRHTAEGQVGVAEQDPRSAHPGEQLGLVVGRLGEEGAQVGDGRRVADERVAGLRGLRERPELGHQVRTEGVARVGDRVGVDALVG